MAQSLEAHVAGLAGRGRVAREQVRGARTWDLADMALALRWGALCFTVVSAFSSAGPARDLRRDLIGFLVLAIYGVVRTIQPLRPSTTSSPTLWLCIEAALCTAVVDVTGGWSSPLLLMVGCALLVAGLLGGSRALAASLVTALALLGIAGAAGMLSVFHGSRSVIALQRIPELAVMGAIGAYAHRIFYAEGSAYNRLRWMNEMHGLLLELYAVTAEHPGLFTVEGAVNATITRLRDVLNFDVVALLLRPPTAEGGEQPWEVAFSDGLRVGPVIANSDLPPALADGAVTLGPVLRNNLASGDGMLAASGSGLYAPILVRRNLAGLLALERRSPMGFSSESCEVIKEVARHAGLAIDNARSFQRLRRLGAEEERGRIARELHDRVGQSLAAVAFNIDRVTASLPSDADPELGPELESLAQEVRAVNGEIREKLTELRGGPTRDVSVVGLLGGMLTTVEARSELAVHFDHDVTERPPEVVEREIWRIGSEAIRNAERHSRGRNLSVSLHSDLASTVLEVADDGCGIPEGAIRTDAYGIVGMRERANLLGATLVIDSVPRRGTTVRLRVPQP